MKSILAKYLNQEIGINYERPFNIESATLIATQDEYFSIVDEKKEYTHHFSYNGIVQILEHPEGIDVGGMFTHKKHFNVVVKVGHLFEYVPA